MYLGILLNAAPLFCALQLLWGTLDTRMPPKPYSEKAGLSRRALALVFTGLLVCWTPILLASWPGFFTYDVGSLYLGEWAQFESRDLNSHHSVFHTLLLGVTVSIGKGLFSSFNAGVALFNIMQSLVISGIFTYLIAWMGRRGASKPMLAAAFAFFALNPVVSMFVLCSNSDTLFAAIAVLLCVQLYDHASSPRRSPALYAAFGATALVFCVLRPNAPYALVLLTPFLLALIPKASRAPMAVTLAVVFSLFLVWTHPVAKLLGVEDSHIQSANAFTLPSQQIAYTYMEGELSDEDVSYLVDHNYVLPSEFDDDLGDYARHSIYDMDTKDILLSWLHVGSRHPSAFLNAFLLQTQDAWNPYSYVNTEVSGDDEQATSFFACDVQEPATLDSRLPGLYDFLYALSHEPLLQRIPFLALLVFLPGYVGLVLLGLARAVITRSKPSALVFLLLSILICSVLLGPGVIVRYYLYLLFGLPLIVFLMFEIRKEEGLVRAPEDDHE